MKLLATHTDQRYKCFSSRRLKAACFPAGDNPARMIRDFEMMRLPGKKNFEDEPEDIGNE